MLCTKTCIHKQWDMLHHRNVIMITCYINENLFFQIELILSLKQHNYMRVGT